MTDDTAGTSDSRDLERLLAFGKQLGRMGTWEVFYDEHGKARTRWSPECYEILGIEREMLEGTIDGFLGRIHRFDVDRVRAVVRRRQQPGPLPELDFRVVHPDGSQRWIVLRGEAEEDGRVIGLVQDVTEHHESAEEAARNDRSLRSLFEHSRDGLLLFNDLIQIVDVNAAAVEIYGESREQLIGARLGAASAPVEVEAGGHRGLGSWDVLERFKRGEVNKHRRSIRRPDGQTREIEAIGIPNFLGEGLHLAVLRDVTERERQAAALREAEARYRSLVEDMPLVTYILGPHRDGAPAYASPNAERLLGHSLERWTREPTFHHQLVHEEDRARIQVELATWTEQEPLEREYRMQAADGSTVWVLDRMVAVRDDQGALVCYQGFLLDVTRRKQLEEQLHKSQRMETIGRLAGGIAHDFNNLLTAITGYSNFALERLGEDDERLARDLQQIRRAAERAAGLTQQLLAFSRRQVLQPRTLDLNAVVADVRALLERLIGEDIELVTELGEAPLCVSADPGRLEQVLVNLAVNARDAMREGGRLTIVVRETQIGEEHPIGRWGAPAGCYPTIAVCDTGVGMDEETLAYVFEPFFTTKEVGLGTGLGLSTVYGIVKQSGGWITLESEPDVGTTATIFLPQAKEASQKALEPDVEPVAGSGTILLVEDEEVVRGLVAEMLEQRGYDVLEAPGPLEALELAEAASCDLLLTDVVMPKMNGRELARRLRANASGLHVVYTSGYAPEAVLDGGRLDSGEYFLQKPFTAVELSAIIQEALEAATAAHTSS